MQQHKMQKIVAFAFIKRSRMPLLEEPVTSFAKALAAASKLGSAICKIVSMTAASSYDFTRINRKQNQQLHHLHQSLQLSLLITSLKHRFV